MKLISFFTTAFAAMLLTACVSESGSNQPSQSTTSTSNEMTNQSAESPEVLQPTPENNVIPPVITTPITPATPLAPEDQSNIEDTTTSIAEPESTTSETPETPEENTPSTTETATTPPESTTTEQNTDEAPAEQAEILPWLRIPMHYEVLLGQPQIWGEAGGTLALNLSQPALAETTTINLESTANLLPQQLISYVGDDGEYYRAQIQSIEGTQILLSTPLKQNISAGANLWNFYDDGSHPNDRGYRVIADYAVRFLDKEQLNEGVHVFLGDSWFEDGVIADRLKTHLPAASFINKGIGGNTSTNLLARFDADVRPYNPSFVWIISGTNDYWQGVTAETYKANLATLVSKIKAINAVPVVFDSSVGPLNFGTDAITKLSQSYVTAIEALLAEN